MKEWKNFQKAMVLLAICLICILLPVQTTYAKVKINAKEKKLYVGDTFTLKVNGTSKKIKWSSANKKIVSVNPKGKITAKGPGTTVVSAKYGSKSVKCIVKVNKSILKYISGDWYTVGGQPWPTKYRFTNNYRYCYICNTDTNQYSYYGKEKVSYKKTNYGYYITVFTKNGIGGYRLFLSGKEADALECIGNGNPYSDSGYSCSSSLTR